LAQSLGQRKAAERQAKKPLAYLIPLPEAEDASEAPTRPVLTLSTEEALVGSDPAQATLLLRAPSVSPVHARLWRDHEGQIRIADRNSTAGTWVNFAPVSPY
jgi:hypothetical protein